MMDFDCMDWNTGTAATKLADSLFGQHVKKSKKSKKRKNENLTKSESSPAKKAKTEELETLTKIPVTTQMTDSTETKTSLKNAKKQKKKLKKMEQIKREQSVENKVAIKTDVKRKSKKKMKEENENSIKKQKARTEDITINDDDKPNLNISPITDLKKKKKRKRKCKRNKFKDYAAEAENALKDTEESSTVAENGSMQNNEKNRKKNKTPEAKLDTNSIQLKNIHASKTLNKKERKFEKNNKLDLSSKNSKPEDKNKTDDEKFDPQQLSAILSANPKAIKAQQKSKKGSIPEEHEETSTKVTKAPKSFLEKSRERLSAARFRYLNEQMYTTTGREALELFQDDPEAFNVYHEGFQGQVEKWPTNPIDIIIDQVKSKQKHLILADFGCGDAKLARSVPNKVHSFDLVALNDHVTACDMSKVPLGNASVDIAVFCLSLMGTNLVGYLQEAHRVLRPGGMLKIAEVTSRFHSVGSFVLKVEKMGFKVISQNGDNKMFVMMDFRKLQSDKHKSTAALEDIQLKPCLYKKR